MVKQGFWRHKQIKSKNEQFNIREVKETDGLMEKQKLDQYDTANLFKINNSNTFRNNKEENMNILVVESRKVYLINL